MDQNTNLNPETNDRAVQSTQPMESTAERQIEPHQQMLDQESGQKIPVTWLDQDEINQLRARWTSIQAQFVDQPRSAVEQAEALVSEAVERINHLLADLQTSLSEQWCTHEDASTEDLRCTIQDYRTFLYRLLDH